MFEEDVRRVDEFGDEEDAKRLHRDLHELKVYVLEGCETMDEDGARELLDNIKNKLSTIEDLIGPNDYWWTPPDYETAEVLRSVHNVLERNIKPKKKGWKRTLSILWDCFWGIVYIAVVLALFRIADGPFQTMVVAGLVLIYNATKASSEGVLNGISVLVTPVLGEVSKIARQVKVVAPVAPLEELARTNTERMLKSGVSALFAGVGSIIALYHILILALNAPL